MAHTYQHFLVLSALIALAAAESLSSIRRTSTTAPLSPRQEVPDDCTFFDSPASKDQDCDYFASTWKITYDQFVSWNPSVGKDCSGITIGQEYCVERNYGIPPPSSTTEASSPEPTDSVPSPIQSGVINSCTSYYKAKEGDSCASIVNYFGVFTLDEFLEWNLAVGVGCGGLLLGYFYCVAIPGMPTTPPDPSPTDGSSPSPTQSGIVGNCVRWHKAVKDDDCTKIVSKYGTFNLNQFKRWNLAVGDDCSGLWQGYYYCIGIPSTPTAPPNPSPTGDDSPSPTQSGIATNCARWHKAVQNDNCAKIVSKYGTFSLAQFHCWNPAVRNDCSLLLQGYWYCIGLPSTPTEPPSPSPTGCTTAPKPTQPGAICKCKKWHKVVKADNCKKIQVRYDITRTQLRNWNKELGSDCTLWLGYNVCVARDNN